MFTTMPTGTRPSATQRELRQSKPFATPEQEAAVSLVRTADHLRREIEQALDPLGLTPQQYNVLRILRGTHPGSLPTLEIGERLIERSPGITRLLDRLEQRKLVRRERCDEDRRRVLCWITPAGLELLERADGPLDKVERDLMKRLSRPELTRLIRQLEILRGAGD
jgi:DNA-binding MarR family transcriptional regulator